MKNNKIFTRTAVARAVTLLGERQALSLRRVNESGGPTYLATVKVRHREPITIEQVLASKEIASGIG